MNATSLAALALSTVVVTTACSPAGESLDGPDGGGAIDDVSQASAGSGAGTRNAAWGNVGRDASGLLHVLAIGDDGYAYEKHQQADQSWSAWAQTAFDATHAPISFAPSGNPGHFGSNVVVATAWVAGQESLVAMALSVVSTPGPATAYVGSVDAGATWVPVGSEANAPASLAVVNCGACGDGLVAVGTDTTGTQSHMALAYQLADQAPTQWSSWINLPAANGPSIHFSGQQVAELDDGTLAVFASGNDGTSLLFMTSHRSPTDLSWNDWTALPSTTDDDPSVSIAAIASVGYAYRGGHKHLVLWATAPNGHVYFLAQNQTTLPTHTGFDTTWRAVEATDGASVTGDSLQAFASSVYVRATPAVANGATTISHIALGSLTGSFGTWDTAGQPLSFQSELAGGFDRAGRIELFDTVAGGDAWQTAQQPSGGWYDWTSTGKAFP